MRDFSGKSSPDGWYDLYEDWGLIESSLAKQYGIRIRQHGDMPWEEFCTLVGGLMPDTPLGSIVSIRAEQEPKTIKGFNADQRRIYNDWRKRQAVKQLDNPVELDQQMKNLEAAMARAFGGE
ncbi:bacteriophage Gp15 family protein [Paenibacillus sp. DR312]|uniref:bacteriophage Gp15 family protein n=1 Tax=unclassified Paenibacillus TaxID=185978 RepID=UPI0021BBE143|nr:bacteriophage Gp15 family protein [Paenibacillus sp. DR312]